MGNGPILFFYVWMALLPLTFFFKRRKRYLLWCPILAIAISYTIWEAVILSAKIEFQAKFDDHYIMDALEKEGVKFNPIQKNIKINLNKRDIANSSFLEECGVYCIKNYCNNINQNFVSSSRPIGVVGYLRFYYKNKCDIVEIKRDFVGSELSKRGPYIDFGYKDIDTKFKKIENLDKYIKKYIPSVVPNNSYTVEYFNWANFFLVINYTKQDGYLTDYRVVLRKEKAPFFVGQRNTLLHGNYAADEEEIYELDWFDLLKIYHEREQGLER